jgi:hypothetical protein
VVVVEGAGPIPLILGPVSVTYVALGSHGIKGCPVIVRYSPTVKGLPVHEYPSLHVQLVAFVEPFVEDPSGHGLHILFKFVLSVSGVIYLLTAHVPQSTPDHPVDGQLHDTAAPDAGTPDL